MAIVFQNDKYNIVIDSNKVIGVMGENYDRFLSSLKGDNIFYLDKELMTNKETVSNLFDLNDDDIQQLLQEYELGKDILKKRVCDLSHSEQKIIKYLLMIISDKKIFIIDEPFIDLDFYYKKKILLLLKKLTKEKKTVIIGSVHSNDIYSICNKVLFINNDSYYYGDISVFKNNKVLKKYHVEMPDLVKFVSLAKEKNIIIGEFTDIRDLIKDVYRNVSQK